eukprot:1133666_1
MSSKRGKKPTPPKKYTVIQPKKIFGDIHNAKTCRHQRWQKEKAPYWNAKQLVEDMSSSHKQKVKKEYKRKLTIEAFKQSDCYTKITIKNKDGIELKAKEREEHDDYKLFMLRQKHIYKDIMDELDAYYA